MKVEVNVNAIGTTIDEHIEINLIQAAMPACLGSMIPPIIKRQVPFDEVSILIEREAISEKEVGSSNVAEIINADPLFYKNKVVTKAGVKKIEDYKIKLAKDYTEQLLKCCSCKYVEVCDKLTKNYLKIISVQEMVKQQAALKPKEEK